MLDLCVIAAGTSSQKQTYEALLEARRARGLYPRELDFKVVADPEGGRVGSGGALLHVLSAVESEYGSGKRILILMAGGRSRRLPCFAPEGKLFAPVPVGSSSLIPPVLFDLQLTTFLRYPWQEGEIVAASGDAAVDFDPAVLPRRLAPLCGLAVPSSLEDGSRHGVFQLDGVEGEVRDYHQKMPVEFLRDHAALDGGSCALDTGIVSLSGPAVEAVKAVAELRTDSGAAVGELTQKGALCFDLYLELLSAAVADLPLEEYLERMKGRSSLSRSLLAGIHRVLSPLRLRAALVKDGRFLHFGDLPGYLQAAESLCRLNWLPFYEQGPPELAPETRDGRILSSSLEVSVRGRSGRGGSSGKSTKRLLCESCRNLVLEEPDGRGLFIGLQDLRIGFPLPDGICVEARTNRLGRFLLVYSTSDTWKPVQCTEEMLFCGVPFSCWLSERSIDREEVLPEGAAADLWEARLWAPQSEPGRLRGYLDARFAGPSWRRWFLGSRRFCLRELDAAEDANKRERERMEIRRAALRKRVLSGGGWRSLPLKDFLESFSPTDAPALERLAGETDEVLVSIYRRRLLEALQGRRSDSVQSLGIDYLSDRRSDRPLAKPALRNGQTVQARSPVRLDLAGGWTDTPPYTLREGGAVLNIAVDLDDEPPVQVSCRPWPEPVIRIHSLDAGLTETLQRFDDLEDCSAVDSLFSLPKAALRLMGFAPDPRGRGSLSERLRGIGCGLEIRLGCAVPKGSGLGTSSILAGALLAALYGFFGRRPERERLFLEVLQVEQMLTTGGGWQDPIGGLVGGVKYIETEPGLRPRPSIELLDPSLFQDPELSACFTLFYTGMTRLAKNILQEVVARVNTLEPAYLFTLRELKALAREAREAVRTRSLPQLAEVLDRSWRSNRLIHSSTTNEAVEALLADLRGLYRGMKLLGAGGGGYALFLSESPAQAESLRRRLKEKHEQEGARIVPMSLNTAGLQVNVR